MTETTRAILRLIAATALARLALAALLGLSVDESYTVAIARQLSLSYFDHPPLHVWLTGVWARLTGSEQPRLLRMPDIVMFAGSTWLMYRLTASAYGERAGFWAALSLNLAPLFTLNAAGGILPDGPLVLSSLLAVWCLTRALRAGESAARGLAWMPSTASGGCGGWPAPREPRSAPRGTTWARAGSPGGGADFLLMSRDERRQAVEPKIVPGRLRRGDRRSPAFR